MQKMPHRQIFLDTETTGLDPKEHRIIEIACLEMINRQFTGNHLHLYIDPERDIDEGAQAIHGITRDSLRGKPLFSAIADELFDFIQGAQIVAHNASFDINFLNREFAAIKINFEGLANHCDIFDTLKLARKLHPSQRNNLDALCKRYKVDNSQRQLHGALMDTQLLAEVYLRMTGGQMNFDVASARHEVKADSTMYFTGNDADHLIVIKPSPEEQAAHEEYLKWLKEQGECVWEAVGSTFEEVE